MHKAHSCIVNFFFYLVYNIKIYNIKNIHVKLEPTFIFLKLLKNTKLGWVYIFFYDLLSIMVKIVFDHSHVFISEFISASFSFIKILILSQIQALTYLFIRVNKLSTSWIMLHFLIWFLCKTDLVVYVQSEKCKIIKIHW